MENRKVIIKHLERTSWSNFHRFPKCKDTIVATLGRDGYNTGLSIEETKEIEKEMSMKEGTLNSYSDYWKNYSFIIMDKPIELDLSKPKDYLDYKVILSSSRIASSMEDLATKPKAEYILFDQEKVAKTENLKVKAKKKAWKVFTGMTISEMKRVLKLMGKTSDKQTDEVVENTLETIIENNPDLFNETVETPDFDLRLMIADMLHYNVLRKIGAKYMYGDDVIGYTYQETIDYLKDPLNQEIIISLKQKLAGHGIEVTFQVEDKKPKKQAV